MLLCKEQKRVINIEGRDICISDKAANAHYMIHTMPITAEEIHMYFNAHSNGDVKSILKNNTSKLLTTLIIEEAKDILSSKFEDFWNSVPQ